MLDEPSTDRSDRGHAPVQRRWLAAFAVAYGLLHHQGVVLARLGEVGGTDTRWADWLDLATPFLVLGAAAGAIWWLGAGRAQWLVFGVGAVLYTEGHGIHLSANSISNVEPSDLVHLWDEVVGHYIWYAGVAVVIAALAWAARAANPLRGVGALGLAILVGVTYATNALEGGTAPLALATGALFVGWGLAARDSATGILVAVFVPALVLIGGYGIWHGGFPEPSSIGWSLL